jgi:glycosyltransferase involved in cell wall biosynthesis
VLTAPSESTRHDYRAWGIEREICVVPCGLEHGAFQLARRPRGDRVRDDRLRVAYIGSVIPSKGAHVLVEAVQMLDPELVQLDVHGEAFPWHGDAGYPERLRRLDRGTHRITQHGRYEPGELPRILADVDVLVVPGLWFETFCLTIREGFLAGIPVVASRLGAMAEAIEHDVTGLLVEPGDAADLARALLRFIDDPTLADRLASAPKSIDDSGAMVARYLRLYDEAIDAVRRSGRSR